MFEDIQKNKIKSSIIVFGFVLLITVIVYSVCTMFDLGIFSVLIALIVSIVCTWSSYYYSDKIVLSMNKARPATHEENQKLVNILDALVISAGLQTKPQLYIIDSNQPNAFATGRNPEHAVICVTTALLETLDYYELEGVVAHELAHIKNYDIMLSAVVSVMIGFIIMLSDIITRYAFWHGMDRDSDSKMSGLAIIIGLVFVVLSPIAGTLMQLSISRKREFLADATSVAFTRNPQGLISALRKLDTSTAKMDTANNSTAYMFITNPFKGKDKKQKQSSLFSTHPSIDARIEALENLK